MKKLVILSLAFIAILASCSKQEPENDGVTEEQLQEASRQELEAAVADRDQLLSLVNEISSGMAEIKRLENILTVSNSVNGETPSQRAQIEADIAAIQQTLQQRREQLEQLERRLHQSTLNNRNLQQTIETLRAQIDSQSAEIENLRASLDDANRQIGELSTTVDSLHTTVTTVTTQRDQAQAETEQIANEMNTCYYVIASKKELKDHKIIESGFLRKTKIMQSDFDQSFFVTADRRTLHTIALHSNKAKVHTNHPAGSYQIVDQNGQKVLKITNPDQFWSLTNYLVIQID